MYWHNRNPLEIIIWDVQHGNAILIKTPNGKSLIHDIGVGDYSENSISFSPLQHTRKKHHLYKIDHLIITHPHLDHIEDILNLDLFRVNSISYPKSISISEISKKIDNEFDSYKKEIFRKYLELIQNCLSPNLHMYNPFLPGHYGGVKIKIYSPKPDVDDSYKENEHSLTTFVFYAGYTILLSGDNGISSWKYLLNNHYFRDDLRNVDVFLASHHGRLSGYHDQIFKFFNPKLTIISDGRLRETSITDIYNSHTKGWYIQNQHKQRKCLTTRYDGAIHLKIGYNSHSYPYLHVRTQYN